MPHEPKQPVRLVVYYGVLGILTGGYVYLGIFLGYWLELAFPYLLLLSAFAYLADRFGIVKLPAGVRIPLVTHWPNVNQLAKAALCVAAGVVWAIVIGRLVNGAGWDNWIGVAIVFGPPIFISVIAALLFVKSMNYQQRK
jgi:hypothetical protein